MAARFEERASKPARGPLDILRWKTRPEPRAADFTELDAIRPAVRDGGAAALASGDPCAVWIGHATYAFRLGGQLVVTDPIWGSITGIPRLVPPGLPLDNLPLVDLVLVTHDHRDHMDLPTINRLPAGAPYI
nr:MBL fold metallo-hydrolase [Deltaproteobacteria bacterium]